MLWKPCTGSSWASMKLLIKQQCLALCQMRQWVEPKKGLWVGLEMSKCWHAAAAQEWGMDTRREGRMWLLLLCMCSSEVNYKKERGIVLLVISSALKVIFHLSSWQNMCAARWEFCFLTDILVDISSGFTVCGVSVSRQTLFLIPLGLWIMDDNWVFWSCSAASVWPDGWLALPTSTLTNPFLCYLVASPLLRLQLAPCFTLCLPWCTWGEFRHPPSLCGGQIERPRGHGDREMPELGETGNAPTSS